MCRPCAQTATAGRQAQEAYKDLHVGSATGSGGGVHGRSSAGFGDGTGRLWQRPDEARLQPVEKEAVALMRRVAASQAKKTAAGHKGGSRARPQPCTIHCVVPVRQLWSVRTGQRVVDGGAAAAAAAAAAAPWRYQQRWSSTLEHAASRMWVPDDADSPETPGDVTDFYDTWADSYDDTMGKWGWEGPERVAEAFARYGCLTSAIVDIGCGTGLSGAELRAVGCSGDIVGVDISTQSLSKAQTRAHPVPTQRPTATVEDDDVGDIDALNPGTRPVYSRTICADVTDTRGILELEQGAFGGVVCVGSLFYLKNDYDAVFSEWHRLLAPGGVCIFSQTLEWQTDEFFGALHRHGLVVSEKSSPCDLHPHNERYQSRAEQQVCYFVCHPER
eukprot:COSAG05_NODE_460_length_9597_cov_8.288798_2_plen_388_part_00